MEQITAIIMPFRDKNIGDVVRGIREQTIKSEIWFWDDTGKFKGRGEDIYFYCNRRFYHRPRFLLAGLVQGDYIYVQDDDFKITNKNLFAELIELEKKYPNYLLGHRGKIFDKNSDREKPYQNSYGWCGEGEVPFVNTGLSFFRTEIINNMPTNAYKNNTCLVSEQEYRYADDMWISKHNKCYSTELFLRSVEKLDECGVGVSHDNAHMNFRNSLCRRYWL